MFLKIRRQILLVFILGLLFSTQAAAQNSIAQPSPTPPKTNDDEPVRLSAEEIRLNVTARNEFEHFDPTLVKEDLMVVEDRVPHPIASLRRVPASVLLMLDTGGEMRWAKSLKTTASAAMNMVNLLEAEDAVAVMQYSDKPEIICEWTTKNVALEMIDKKLNFGRRSTFVSALTLAANFLSKREPQNRHLVIIADGMDSMAKTEEREAAIKKLIEANVSVHILSYTEMERKSAPRQAGGIFQQGDGRIPRRTDENHKITLPGPIQTIMNAPRLGSITTDVAWLKKMKKHAEDLQTSEKQLNALATDTGGMFFKPENAEQMLAESRQIADLIDSQYVATYIPKRPLENSPAGEVREIEVISRRVGLKVQARRKFIVPKSKI